MLMNANPKIEHIKNLFSNIQDEVLDEYNEKGISKEEMINVLTWCEKMKNKMIEAESNNSAS